MNANNNTECAKVSVIIPTYNYAHYILEAIGSVLDQDYPTDKIEIVVVDDGSTDNTAEVLKPLIDDGTVKYHYQQNKGKASATYSAIQKSTGKYIFNLDADDYFLPGKIALTVGIFEGDDEIAHVANPAKFIMDGKDNGEEHIPAHLLEKKWNGVELLTYFYNERMLFGGGSTFAGRASVLKTIFIPDAVDMYIDEFLILATLNKGPSYFIGKPLSIWRGHTSNYTVKQANVQAKNKRLDDSSKGILDEMAKGDYPLEIKKLYALHHGTRHVFFKEAANSKTFKDVLELAKLCFITHRYTLKQLRGYSVFNRFIPMFLIKILKGNKQ